ncbi:mitochondrial ribosomal protein L37 domain-containing protein [Trichoderma novae-zelandiae]
MFCARCLRATVARRQLPLSRHAFSSSPPRFYSAAEPQLSTPATDAGDASKPGSTTTSSRSICPEGTVLTGLNYIKGGQDPVAMKDEDYPEWLWSCLDVMKKADAEDDNHGDEFSKSKKQRKLAAKRQKALEAKLLAEGNLEALAPKVPLPHQSVNLPGDKDGSVLDNIAAAEKREELRKAMRKERRATIKESNYLKSM